MIQMAGAQFCLDKVYIHAVIDIHTETGVSFVVIKSHKSEVILTCNINIIYIYIYCICT